MKFNYENEDLTAEVAQDLMEFGANLKAIAIKVKTSHSKWYQNDIENVPSTYHYQVPVEVEKEARELQLIRRKHQDDENFSFYQTNYLKREVRVADHYNY